MRFVPASDTSLLVVVDESDTPSLAASSKVHALFHAIRAHSFGWLRDLHPAYTTLLVDFDPRAITRDAVQSAIAALPVDENAALTSSKLVELPVTYDGEDLAFVAQHTNLTIEDVIAKHTAPTYVVAFLGFSPGFAYLLGMDAALTTPRLDVPRAKVPAGAVAIGGAQTAVYPSTSPGGWRVIGHVDAKLVERADWCDPGDVVRFVRA